MQPLQIEVLLSTENFTMAARHGRSGWVNWKAMRRPAIVVKIEFYDLSKDIGEETNLADKFPVEVAKLDVAMKTAYVPSPAWKFRKPRPARKPKAKRTKP